jgi:hypothetical protein
VDGRPPGVRLDGFLTDTDKRSFQLARGRIQYYGNENAEGKT